MNGIISTLFPPIHKEGYKFILFFVIITLLMIFIANFLFFIGVCLTVWCYYFFRDPVRFVPQLDGCVISPADGKVCAVDKAIPPSELGLSDTPMTRPISESIKVFIR